ncbi:hypothetical protein [Cellulomonas sp. KRMCY2]|uniref:hypothetical protein n=1 Tax=Cellulomonas sp. KRMCY2 TaxID=1304865 RepID=UPI00045E8994|nr:hypothetical protein [Cellulomonas sp. KRMCY2]
MIQFAQISFERAVEFRDHVEAREPFFLQELAGWMDATGGPVEGMDASAESLVELWAWFVGFVDAGCPGVATDLLPADQPDSEPCETSRLSAVAERVNHDVRLVVARYDPPAPWAVLRSPKGRPPHIYQNHTGIQRSDGQVPDFEFVGIISRGLVTGRARTREPDRLLQLVQARYPAVVLGGVRGESVLAPYLTADLGPVPPQAVSPVLRWLAEPEPPARPAPAPPAPAGRGMVKQPQLVVMRGPGAGLEDPRLLEPLDEAVVAAALVDLGYTIEGRRPAPADLTLDEATFTAGADDMWVSELCVAAHDGRLRLVDVNQTVATPEHWDRVVSRLRRLARDLGAALGEPDDLDTDD